MTNTETKVKHTPGPWKWENWPSGKALCSNGMRILGCIPQTKRDCISDANAKLIAAAPSLLQVAEDFPSEAILCLNMGKDTEWAYAQLDAWHEKRKAAIAKALGTGQGKALSTKE